MRLLSTLATRPMMCEGMMTWWARPTDIRVQFTLFLACVLVRARVRSASGEYLLIELISIARLNLSSLLLPSTMKVVLHACLDVAETTCQRQFSVLQRRSCCVNETDPNSILGRRLIDRRGVCNVKLADMFMTFFVKMHPVSVVSIV